jgi:hypothetical protein
MFTLSAFPSPVTPSRNGCPWAFSELRTRQLLATHVRAGTGLEILTGSYVSGIKPDLQSTYSLTSCDLVSHLTSAGARAGHTVRHCGPACTRSDLVASR